MTDGSVEKGPPEDLSVDGLIRWLADQRRASPDLPLRELIDDGSLSADGLVELACMDLIGLRRAGRDVQVEDYLRQFDALKADPECVLDLVDAEVCVRRELQDLPPESHWMDRFPELADPIRQLLHLDPGVLPAFEPAEPREIDSSLTASDVTVDFSLEAPRGESMIESIDQVEAKREMTVPKGKLRRGTDAFDQQRSDDSITAPLPIRAPEWFAGAKCVATSQTRLGRTWLVTGRDTERGDSVAMKLLPMGVRLGPAERSAVLDLCEAASAVGHDAWVAPRIAAISQGYLAVVRPWVFGTPLEIKPSSDDRWMRQLVRVAFSLSAAHRIGTTHGHVCESNVIIDHQSDVALVDAVAGASCWRAYLAEWQNELAQTLSARIVRDSRGLLSLIAKGLIDDGDRIPWLEALTRSVDLSRADACAEIGERLQSFLDQPPPATMKSWWRR